MTIPVCWWNRERMSYSCCHLLNQMFDNYGCIHSTRHDPPPDGCVLVFHGGNEQLFGNGVINADRINTFVSDMRFVIFVSIGDEATEFPLELLTHRNKKLWVQTPLPSTKADRYLIEGFPERTQRIPSVQNLNWFFAGQNTHARRNDCVAALKETSIPGILATTQSFGSGLPQSDYLRHMSRAKIVPCPSGPASPDTFRVWEALECGAVPIVDSRSLRESTVGFWDTVLGDHPLPLISDWKDLPEAMEMILSDYDRYSRLCAVWWKCYKYKFFDTLGFDLIALDQ